MRARLLIAGLVTLGLVTVQAQQRPAAEGSPLPVRRVILYKSGVGYFEHLGSVTGNSEVALQFTTGQLNELAAKLSFEI